MSLQPLYCVAEDRHRAVLLTGCLADMGNPVRQLEQPTAETSASGAPAMVLWTRRSAESAWLRDLFTRDPDTIALVVDEIPPPAACRQAVALQDWPARSADASIGALVRWLHNPGSARSPFLKSQNRVSQPETSNRMAYLVIGACLLFLIGAVITSQRSSDESTPNDSELQRLGVETTAVQPEGVSEQTSAPAVATSQAAVAAKGSMHLAAEGSFSSPPRALSAEGSSSLSAAGAAEGPRSTEGASLSAKSTAGEDSLSHLCRARTPEAALAWFRVLSPALQRVVLDIDCVQALLARPEFAGLEAEFQA